MTSERTKPVLEGMHDSNSLRWTTDHDASLSFVFVEINISRPLLAASLNAINAEDSEWSNDLSEITVASIGEPPRDEDRLLSEFQLVFRVIYNVSYSWMSI